MRSPWASDYAGGRRLRPRLIDLVEHAAVVEELLLRLAPITELLRNGEQLELRELGIVLLRHLAPPRTVEILRGDILPLRRIEELQIGFGYLARAVRVDDLVDDGNRRFGHDALRRHDDLELVGSKLLDREEGLALPGQEHVADTALGEGDGRAARATVEHRHVLVEI